MKGNCIDKFIDRRMTRSIIDILKLRSSIRRRIDFRDKEQDYFNSICYEEDFTHIRKIKEEASHLVNECNKFLERISEQYSKLS